MAAHLESKGIHLDTNNIEACHPIPRRSTTDKAAAILRFVNRKYKMSLLKQGKKLKGTSMFMRKMGKITNTWTCNCKIFLKLNGPQEKGLVIRRMEELET